MECPFCIEIQSKAGRIIRETEHTVTLLSNPKLMDGHLLVIPKRHIEKPVELTEEERKYLFNEVIEVQEKVLSKIAPGCDISEHFRPFIPDSKYKVNHLHFHIRPRFLDDELYMRVQIEEKNVFKDIDDGEWEKYKEILK